MNKEPIQKEDVKTATEMMVNDMQEEEYYRIKHTPSDTFIEEIAKEAHIKWLSKSKTVKIDGQELTVLPYGYLGQAVKSSLQEQRQSILEEIEKKKFNELINRKLTEVVLLEDIKEIIK